MLYEYLGGEDKIYTDVTGKRRFLKKGDVFESKVEPKWETIVEREKSKKKYIKKNKEENK